MDKFDWFITGVLFMGLFSVFFLNVWTEETQYYQEGYEDALTNLIECYSLEEGALRSFKLMPYENYTCEDYNFYTPDLFWESVTFPPRINEERREDE